MYTDPFIKEVKETYPASVIIQQLAEDGSYHLGEFLKKYAKIEISPERILAAENLEEIQYMAKALQQRRDLYKRWLELTEKDRYPIYHKNKTA